jgi:hypothetical protein
MAHELGHNLGMNHDFLSSPSEYRYDSQVAIVCTFFVFVTKKEDKILTWGVCP